LRAADKPYEVLDPTRKGLMLRVLATGTKTFYFRYQRRGMVHRLRLGRYPATTLRSAYEAHADYTRRLHRGENLHTARHAQASATHQPEPTVLDLCREFLERYIYRERKCPEAAERLIEVNVLKYWEHRSVKEVTRRDAILLLDRIVDRGAPTSANRVAALLSQMFRFGVERGLLEASPLIALPRPGGTEKPRDRALNEQEIRIFWRKLTRARMSPGLRLGLKLILVTGQRPGEVAYAAQAEFDLDNRLWTIPAERSKNGKPHQVPLSRLAVTLLAHLWRLTGATQYLLPSPQWRERDGAAVTRRSLAHAVRNNEQCFGIPHFTPHDLRRTAASMMTACGIPRLHVEKILNHTIDDVAEIYDRYDYLEEKRIALEKWADALGRILRGESITVVQLRQARSDAAPSASADLPRAAARTGAVRR
jgi:integrase